MGKALLIGLVLSAAAAAALITAGGSSADEVHEKPRSDNNVVPTVIIQGVSGKST
ncbi:hypothetical protein [Solihabitans fulvus]|uniref:hypothetical protein n=1 Tax=Solihabitans fulvus TaxID=1892852 RepID=UPI00166198A0|nr:hypothetical protein [Solihabitans fulvus]